MNDLELLDETAAHYNERNRSVDEYGQCAYLGPGRKRCAAGRLIDLRRFPGGREGLVACEGRSVRHIAGSLGKELLHSLKPQYRGVTLAGIYMAQQLHDCESYWLSEGLSPLGKSKLQEMKDRLRSTIE